jgi:hypothetical protein
MNSYEFIGCIKAEHQQVRGVLPRELRGFSRFSSELFEKEVGREKNVRRPSETEASRTQRTSTLRFTCFSLKLPNRGPGSALIAGPRFNFGDSVALSRINWSD